MTRKNLIWVMPAEGRSAQGWPLLLRHKGFFMEELMQVRINGEDVFLPQGVSLSAIITERKINAQAVVVEYNGVILTREKWKPVVLKENDTLEIVSFVGGG